MQKLVLAYMFTDPSFDILKLEMNDQFKELIYDNLNLWKYMWTKYISKNLPKSFANMGIAQIREEYQKIIKLYSEPVGAILHKPYNEEKKYKKYDIIYNNAKNLKKIFYNLDNDIIIDDELLSKIVYFDQKNYFGDTILLGALKYNRIDIVKWLINKKINVNVVDKYDMTPLRKAFDINNIEIVQLLIENGVNVNYQDSIGYTVLHYNVKSPEYIKLLLENGADPNIKNNDNETALMRASADKNIKSMKLLIKYGTDVNVQSKSGATALTYTGSNSVEIVRLLINNGANVNLKDDYGRTALDHIEDHNNLPIIKLYLKNGYDINSKDKYDNTFIMNVKSFYLDTLKYLLDNGADLYIKNHNNQTVLIKMADSYHQDILQFLLEYINNDYDNQNNDENNDKNNDKNNEKLNFINIQDVTGDTALIIACRKSIENVKLLLKYGADPNISNELGYNALAMAVTYKKIDIIKLLLKRNVNLNATNISGGGILISAIMNNIAIEIIELLIKSGIDINIRDNHGKTALGYIYKSDKNIKKLLLDHGAIL